MGAKESSRGKPKALGHLALHYRPGDSALVVRLFRSLGLRVEDFGAALEGLLVQDPEPSPLVDRGYRVFINSEGQDGFFFAVTATSAQLALEDALIAAPPAALEDYRKARAVDPEASFHIGIRYESLEQVEHAIETLEAALAEDNAMANRVTIARFKAHSSLDPAVAERMAASPVFRPDDRDAFVENAVQVFIQTDIAAGGLLCLGQTIELDYVFPVAAPHFPPVAVFEPL